MFVLKAENDYLSHGMTLDELIPIAWQRLTKYKLLIEGIHKTYEKHMEELDGEHVCVFVCTCTCVLYTWVVDMCMCVCEMKIICSTAITHLHNNVHVHVRPSPSHWTLHVPLLFPNHSPIPLHLLNHHLHSSMTFHSSSRDSF